MKKTVNVHRLSWRCLLAILQTCMRNRGFKGMWISPFRYVKVHQTQNKKESNNNDEHASQSQRWSWHFMVPHTRVVHFFVLSVKQQVLHANTAQELPDIQGVFTAALFNRTLGCQIGLGRSKSAVDLWCGSMKPTLYCLKAPPLVRFK